MRVSKGHTHAIASSKIRINVRSWISGQEATRKWILSFNNTARETLDAKFTYIRFLQLFFYDPRKKRKEKKIGKTREYRKWKSWAWKHVGGWFFFVRSRFRFDESDDNHFFSHAFNAKFRRNFSTRINSPCQSFHKMRLIMDFGMASQSWPTEDRALRLFPNFVEQFNQCILRR